MAEDLNYKLGSIIFYKNIPAFLSWVQRAVLGIPYSHTAIYIGKNELGRMEEFEANVQLNTTTFTDSKEYREVYYIKGIEDIKMKIVLNGLIDVFEEKTYGFGQWGTIFIRRCFEWMGFKRAKNWNILWGIGVVCSELVFYYLIMVSAYMDWWDLHRYLNAEYHPNTFHPGDVKDVIDKFPQYFERM